MLNEDSEAHEVGMIIFILKTSWLNLGEVSLFAVQNFSKEIKYWVNKLN